MKKIGILQIETSLVGPLALDKIARSNLADVVVLISNIESFAEQNAADIQSALEDVVQVVGGTDCTLLKGAEIVIITGAERMIRGMVREDRIRMNKNAFLEYSVKIREVAPQAHVIVAPFNITSAEALREIVAAVQSQSNSVTQILPPEIHGAYEAEGPFKVSERILSAVDGFAKSD